MTWPMRAIDQNRTPGVMARGDDPLHRHDQRAGGRDVIDDGDASPRTQCHGDRVHQTIGGDVGEWDRGLGHARARLFGHVTNGVANGAIPMVQDKHFIAGMQCQRP